MPFSPLNFVDKVGPAVPAAWLNALDQIQGYFTITSTGLGTLGPPTASGATLTIIGGSGGASTPPLVLTSTGTTHFQIAGSGQTATPLDLAQLPDGTVVIQNSANQPIQFTVNALPSLQVDGTQIVQAWEKTDNVAAAGFFPVATVESGSFTGTLNGCTGGPYTATIFWRRVGPIVYLWSAGNLIGAASSPAGPTITGLPAALAPAPAIRALAACLLQDNTVNETGYVSLAGAATTIVLLRNNGSTVFSSTGNKGVGLFTLVYTLT